MSPISKYLIGFSLMLMIVVICSKPINDGDMVNPDEFEIYSQIFEKPDNTSVTTNTITKKPTIPVDLQNRHFIQVPCRKGNIRIGMMCREAYELDVAVSVMTFQKKITFQQEKTDVIKFLKEIPYFDDWNDTMREECEKYSKIKCFDNEEVIYGDPFNTDQYVYFIMNGKAKAVQMIQFKKNCDKNDINTDVYFIEVYIFSKMSCFNIGEDLHDRVLIACCTNTQCLLIPRFWLLEINKKLWHRMRFFFERNIPTQHEVEERFCRKRRFSKHSEYLAKKIHEKSKKSPYNHFCNIPLTLRLDQI